MARDDERPGSGGRFRLTRRTRSKALACVGTLAAVALGACARHPQSVLHPAGPVARMELSLMATSLWIMIGVFVVVAGALLYVIARFREHKGQEGLPPQVEGSHILEILWTGIPIILVVILTVFTVRTTFALAKAPAPSSRPLQVTVIGHQWWWEFEYPQYGVVTADTMHIPVNRKIELSLESADVLHSFWIPALGGKEDTVPGQVNHMWLEATQTGTFPGQCAEFCGTSHSLMRMYAVSQSAAGFSTWIHGMQHPNSAPKTKLAKQGMQIFATNCALCHSIGGTPFTKGTLGPNLTGLGNRRVIVGGALQNTTQDVIYWVHDAQHIMPDTIMPNFSTLLTPSQLRAVAAYLEGLKRG